MEGGTVYVVHNDSIQNPAAKEGDKTYKIGKTKNTVDERYSGLLMPCKYECVFAFEFDLEKYGKVETSLHTILSNRRVRGEWFDLDAETLAFVRKTCEVAGGKLITETVEKVLVEEETEAEEESDGIIAAELDPFLVKVATRWNEVSDMKVVDNGPKKRHIYIPGIGSGGRQVCYFFDCFCAGDIRIGLSYPADANLFQEPITIKGIAFETRRNKEIRTSVPQTTDVDRVVEIMQSLIEATKEKIISVWGKEQASGD